MYRVSRANELETAGGDPESLDSEGQEGVGLAFGGQVVWAGVRAALGARAIRVSRAADGWMECGAQRGLRAFAS